MKEAFFQGKFVPFEDAKISIMTHAFNYGTGVFEGIRGYWSPSQNKMFVLQARDHFERMVRSCKIMRIGLRYSVDELVEMTLELAKRNGYREDIYIRPLAYKSSTVVGVRLHDLEDDFCMFISPFGAYLDTARGIRVCTSSWRRIDDNTIPARAKITGVYVNSAFSKTEAMEGGFAEAIVLDLAGHVAEGSAENIFIVRDGQLITPPPSDSILEGITRATIMKMAKDELGITTLERSIDRTELYIADEVFLCGTGAQVTPVTEVDRRMVGTGAIGSITSRLHQLYFQAVRGDNPKYISLLQTAY